MYDSLIKKHQKLEKVILYKLYE